MVLALLSLLSLYPALGQDWQYHGTPGYCEPIVPLKDFNIDFLLGTSYQIIRTTVGIFGYADCSGWTWTKNSDNVLNYIWFGLFPDGHYYSSDFVVDFETDRQLWGSGGMDQPRIPGRLPFQILETDYKTYTVWNYCYQMNETTKGVFFEVYSTERDFDATPYLHYAYERGFKSEELIYVNQNPELCSDPILNIHS